MRVGRTENTYLRGHLQKRHRTYFLFLLHFVFTVPNELSSESRRKLLEVIENWEKGKVREPKTKQKCSWTAFCYRAVRLADNELSLTPHIHLPKGRCDYLRRAASSSCSAPSAFGLARDLAFQDHL